MLIGEKKEKNQKIAHTQTIKLKLKWLYRSGTNRNGNNQQ